MLKAQRLLLAVLISTGICSGAVNAQDSNFAPTAGSWFTQNGPIIINFRHKSNVLIDGVPAAVEANPGNNVTMSNSIGYNFTPNLSAQLVLGVTPETDVTTQTGTKLGSITYGAPSILVDYRWTRFGAFQPFVGVGGMFIFVSDEKDGALRNLKVDNTFGLILRAGSELMITKQVGIYMSANKIFAETEASGMLGASRVDAKLDLSPWIYQFGVSYRF